MFQTIKHGTLEYLTSDLLRGSAHCFSTRLGGVSTGALASLNLGTHRGDEPENVRENYRILGCAVGFTPEQTVFTRQEHTDRLLVVGKADCGTGLLREQQTVCDGILTDEPDVALVCFGADCATVLLFDPVRQAIAAVHAGWRGMAQGIVYKAVLRMQQEFGCQPQHIRAAIGPCISRCCFEVGAEVPQAMRDALGASAEAAIVPCGEKYHVDLKQIGALWLRSAGVQQIDLCPACTMCQPERFWSHRITGANRGSQAAIIKLCAGGAVR